MNRKQEPLIHMVNDSLPEGHELCGSSENCIECETMLLASNNEFMCIWIETQIGNYCDSCFFKDIKNIQQNLED